MSTNTILLFITILTLLILLGLIIVILPLKKKVYSLITDFNDIKTKVDKASTTIDKMDHYIQVLADFIKNLIPKP
jgi:cell division protein FtsL